MTSSATFLLHDEREDVHVMSVFWYMTGTYPEADLVLRPGPVACPEGLGGGRRSFRGPLREVNHGCAWR